MNNKTFFSSEKPLRRKWYLVDCAGKSLGRMSSIVTAILQGKHKLWYKSSDDLGDCVILINAMDLRLGNTKRRTYVFNPGRPGKSLTSKQISEDVPERVIKNCIKNMMKKGSAKRNLAKRIKIYTTSYHPHTAQTPIYLKKDEEIKIYKTMNV